MLLKFPAEMKNFKYWRKAYIILIHKIIFKHLAQQSDTKETQIKLKFSQLFIIQIIGIWCHYSKCRFTKGQKISFFNVLIGSGPCYTWAISNRLCHLRWGSSSEISRTYWSGNICILHQATFLAIHQKATNRFCKN